MSKDFIECIESTRKHYIFTGKNALQQALFFNKYGRIATPDELFKKTFKVDNAISWSDCISKNEVGGVEICGKGVHAKIYTTPNCVIYSSQNNGASPLFEFAILYKANDSNGYSRLLEFTKKSIARAVFYSKWWIANKKWKS